jgi:hypothetical protein
MQINAFGRFRKTVAAMLIACTSHTASGQFEALAPPATPAGQPSAAGEMGYPEAIDWYRSEPSNAYSILPQTAAARLNGGHASGRTSGLFVAADYLLIRPHFSEAIAFARGTQDMTSMVMVEEPLAFDHQSSFRAMFGYRSAQDDSEIRFTYWHIDSDVIVNAGSPGPGQFIVDPFGNMVGAAVVMNPGDTRFGTPITMTGESIATTASVRLNVFDIDWGISVAPHNPNWSIDFTAGVRIAEVDQFYDSVIFDGGGAQVSRGDFTVDFVGAGPRMGSGIRRIFGQDRQFAVFTQGSGALLLGQYDLAFSNSVGGFSGRQTQSMTRLIPVVDTEVGASWRATDRLTLAGGYLFQAWFDFGTSGGKFDGFFSGTDDANIMSFDGMFLRAELAF